MDFHRLSASDLCIHLIARWIRHRVRLVGTAVEYTCLCCNLFFTYQLLPEKIPENDSGPGNSLVRPAGCGAARNLCAGAATGSIHAKRPLIASDADGLPVDLLHTGKNFTLLYFWSSRCGLCRVGFPLLQKLHERYAGSEAVVVNSVFCTDNERIGIENDYLAEHGYTFPCLRVDQRDPVLEEMKTAKHPITLILDETSFSEAR